MGKCTDKTSPKTRGNEDANEIDNVTPAGNRVELYCGDAVDNEAEEKESAKSALNVWANKVFIP
jgi:hypothetical protein